MRKALVGASVVLWAIALAGAPEVASARTAEVYLIVKVDLQRLHPDRLPDEPLEPTPSIVDMTRQSVAAHPAFRGIDTRILTAEAPPSPRVPADFLRLIDHQIDEVVVVNLAYHLRLDNFRATGSAAMQGFVAVHSVAGRRQVASRSFTVTAAYPGEVTKEAVIQAAVAARARGASVPVEEVELGLLDAAVKQRLERELAGALSVYHAASLPPLSRQAIQEALGRMARVLSESPARRVEAVETLEAYLRRYPDSPHQRELGERLRRLKRVAGRPPGDEARVRQERAAQGVAQTLTAAELAAVFEQVIGTVVEVRAFKLDWRDEAVMMTPTNKNQDFVLEQVPDRVRELEIDPPAIYVQVVGRRIDPRIPGIDIKIPVLRWVGCPSEACPSQF